MAAAPMHAPAPAPVHVPAHAPARDALAHVEAAKPAHPVPSAQVRRQLLNAPITALHPDSLCLREVALKTDSSMHVVNKCANTKDCAKRVCVMCRHRFRSNPSRPAGKTECKYHCHSFLSFATLWSTEHARQQSSHTMPTCTFFPQGASVVLHKLNRRHRNSLSKAFKVLLCSVAGLLCFCAGPSAASM